jgi:CAI-1 autoinducer synthase
MRVRDALEAEGVFGAIFSAPATAKNRSLLRLTLNAAMTDDDIARLVAACRAVRERVDLDAWSAARRARRGASRDALPSLVSVA